MSPSLSLNLSQNAVHHYICHQFCPKIYHKIWWFTKFVTTFGDKFGDKFVTKDPGGPTSGGDKLVGLNSQLLPFYFSEGSPFHSCHYLRLSSVILNLLIFSLWNLKYFPKYCLSFWDLLRWLNLLQRARIPMRWFCSFHWKLYWGKSNNTFIYTKIRRMFALDGQHDNDWFRHWQKTNFDMAWYASILQLLYKAKIQFLLWGYFSLR